MNTKKTKTKQYVDGNQVEAFRDTVSNVGSAVVDELGKASVNSLWDQLLGRQSNSSEDARPERNRRGDLSQGQEISLRAHQETINRNIEAGYNYRQEILRSGERHSSEDKQAIESQIDQIMGEISKIMTEAVEMKETVKEIRVQKRMVKPGKYHLSFLSFVLSAVRSARKTVENSASWLTAMKSKKKQKSYWAQFKKRGTEFALSNERNVATQVG